MTQPSHPWWIDGKDLLKCLIYASIHTLVCVLLRAGAIGVLGVVINHLVPMQLGDGHSGVDSSALKN